MDKLAYSPAEAAARLGIGRTRVFAAIKAGTLRSYKYGARTRLISRSALLEFQRLMESEDVAA